MEHSAVEPSFSVPYSPTATSLLRVADMYGMRWDVYEDECGEWRLGLYGDPSFQHAAGQPPPVHVQQPDARLVGKRLQPP